MAEIGKGILDGFKSVGDIASRKARLVQLGSQAKAAKQRIGQAAYEQGIECGPASQAARETHDVLEKAAERSAVAAEAMKSATGVKAKAMATKDAATATAARKLAESKVRAAHETLGDHVLVHNVAVPGMEAEITNAQTLVEQIRSLNTEVGGLGRGLMGNKIGFAVVACTALAVVIVVVGLGWYILSGTGDNLLSAPELYAAYASDRAAASGRYEGKTITLRGQANPALRLSDGTVALPLSTNEKGYHVICYFSGSTSNRVDIAAITEGAQIVVRARCTGQSAHGDVTLDDAILVDVGGGRSSPPESIEESTGAAQQMTREEVINLLISKGASLGHTFPEGGITKTALQFTASQEDWEQLLGKPEFLTDGYSSFGNMNYQRWRYRCKDGPLTFHGDAYGNMMRANRACYY